MEKTQNKKQSKLTLVTTRTYLGVSNQAACRIQSRMSKLGAEASGVSWYYSYKTEGLTVHFTNRACGPMGQESENEITFIRTKSWEVEA